MQVHSQNVFQKKAVDKLAQYSSDKRRFVADLITSIGQYFRKDLSEQVTYWISDLIDLDEDDLIRAWDEIRLNEDSGYVPQPSKIRKIALNLQRERNANMQRTLAALDDELRPEQVLNLELTNKRFGLISRIMNGEKLEMQECLDVFGKKITEDALLLSNSWMKTQQEPLLPLTVQESKTNSFLLTDDMWT